MPLRLRGGLALPLIWAGTLSAVTEAAPSGHVGSAMAVLSTLEDARVLPPEGTPDANRVVKIVIQLQSALMKSSDPALREFFQRSLVTQFGESQATEMQAVFFKAGWNSFILEALDRYRTSASGSEINALAPAFSRFNVTVEDFEYLLDLFHRARLEYQRQGQDIHRIFAERRHGMPGAGS